MERVNTYTVKKGDCIWNIASTLLGGGATDAEIARLQNRIIEINDLNSNGDIQIDQNLYVPTFVEPYQEKSIEAKQTTQVEGSPQEEPTQFDGFTYRFNKFFREFQLDVEDAIDEPGQAIVNGLHSLNESLRNTCLLTVGGISHDLGLDNFTNDYWNQTVSDIADVVEDYNASDAFDKGQYKAAIVVTFAGLVVERKMVNGRMVVVSSELKTISQIVPDGFVRTNFQSHGQKVFYNSKKNMYITPDVDGHNGGA